MTLSIYHYIIGFPVALLCMGIAIQIFWKNGGKEMFTN